MAYRLVPNRRLPVERFIHAWQTSPSPAEAARRLARSSVSAQQTAKDLRALGVPLRRFDPPARQASVACKRQRGRKSRRTLRLVRLALSYGWAVQA